MNLSFFFQSVAIATLMNLWPLAPVMAEDVVVFLEHSTSSTGIAEFYAFPEVATRWEDNVTAQAEYVFTLTNDTSVDMLEFYASPQTATDWETNILADKTIRANGDWTTITLPSSRGCLYDFLAVFADGDKLEKYGINVCELETHTYYEN
ncbi:MAG: hypothetical protein AAGA46_15445 [Cyanobacteria bacterium P01_F01_bin.13]